MINNISKMIAELCVICYIDSRITDLDRNDKPDNKPKRSNGQTKIKIIEHIHWSGCEIFIMNLCIFKDRIDKPHKRRAPDFTALFSITLETESIPPHTTVTRTAIVTPAVDIS